MIVSSCQPWKQNLGNICRDIGISQRQTWFRHVRHDHRSVPTSQLPSRGYYVTTSDTRMVILELSCGITAPVKSEHSVTVAVAIWASVVVRKWCSVMVTITMPDGGRTLAVLHAFVSDVVQW